MTDVRRRILVWGLVLLAALLGGGTAAAFYADFHWFSSLGFESRFWKLELVDWSAWFGLFALTVLVVGGVLRQTVRAGGPIQVRRTLGDLEIAEAVPERWVEIGVLGGAVLVGLLVASPFAGPLGRQTLFALGSEPWGRPDAILGNDPRYYIFYLPLLRTLWSVAVAILTWTAIGLTSYLLLSGRVRAGEQGVELDGFARRRLVGLAIATLLVIGAHFHLSIQEVVAGGPVGYADVHGDIPARRLVAILCVLAAGGVLYSQRTGSWRATASLLMILGIAWPAGTMAYPELIQRFRVEPNEFELERPYIQAEIDATRHAFGLEEIRRVDYEVEDGMPPADRLERYTGGLPLWDERPLRATFNQLQGLLAYHEFPDVDPDRYGEGSELEQVAIGVREFAPGRLTASARTWQNLHLRYTHGQGVVVTPVDRATEGGEPSYYLQDLPPELSPGAPPGLTVQEPEVFFGERTTEYIVVPPDSFPRGGAPAGVALDGLFRRSVLAWALGSKNILLRNVGEGRSRLVWDRDVVRRVNRVAPFLAVDGDPYPVLHEGRVKWFVELYAVSDRYPLSQPHEIGGRRADYLRSVVKAVVDGVTGEVDLYVVAPEDPLLQTYRRTFPDLFLDLEEMPDGLRSHVRYPPNLFRTQAQVLQAYHMTDPSEFYQLQDLWSIGQEVYEGQPAPVDPYYLVMPFPGEEGASVGAEREFLLTAPFTPRARDNLAAFMIARNDGDRYGELWLYDLSGQEQVFGPRQVEVQIDQDPLISQQLSLWRQQGSRAIRGHLLLVPVEGHLVYVEPLFLEAEDREGAAPGLKRVIAAVGDRVAMGLTLEEALDVLLGEAEAPAPTADVVGEAPEDAADPVAADPTEAAPGPEAGAPGGSLQQLRSLLQQADRALREGDLERFGRLWEQIRGIAGQEGTGSSTPSTDEAAGDTAASSGDTVPERPGFRDP